MKTLVLFTITCAVVIISLWSPKLMLNPGQLSQGHQKIEQRCNYCHEYFWGINDARCISCHPTDQIDKYEKLTGKPVMEFHKGLKDQPCITCHTDHKGTAPSLTTYNFNHKILSPTLLSNCSSCHIKPGDSLHAQLSGSCGGCHNTTAWQLSGGFEHRLISKANMNNCSSCHQKPSDALHSGLQNQCNDCHSTSNWHPATFDHSEYFVLDRDHNTKCETCHSRNLNSYSCFGCHEHSEARIAKKHNEEGIYQFDNCASCHKSGDEHDIRSNDGGKTRQDAERIRDYINDDKKDKKHYKEHDND
jgi:hypothetical protein